MSKKLLYIFLVSLIGLNVTLMILLIRPDKKTHPRNQFLIEALNFSQDQQLEFERLDQMHRQTMRNIDDEIKREKDKFFQSISKEDTDVQLRAKKMGELEAKKDIELHRFFSEVRKICTPKQQESFDKIISEAIRGGRKGPRPGPHGKRPPPRDF